MSGRSISSAPERKLRSDHSVSLQRSFTHWIVYTALPMLRCCYGPEHGAALCSDGSSPASQRSVTGSQFTNSVDLYML